MCFNYLHFFLQSPSPSRVDRTCPLEEEIKLLNQFIQKIFQYLYYLILTSSKGQHLEQLWSGHGESRA